ncbi:MAG: NUDIX hydrolase [Candidatus Devosia phytovorans]|uniref:NUDIX hydrolase n=1 Tax=Candidatus Devosia phytovorans TaxID=3121372 RepID=A0AAJ6B2Q9_9HYPH|nr:NUDIX hydrolase [Devosia sp.]WEK06804.1 MAG: NUDIX hydrolase [Devosia sp.]
MLGDPDGSECGQVAALPWRQDADGKVRLLLVTSRTNAKWMLPKGWPMEGKTAAEAALVEANEEAGIDGEVSEAPIGSYRYLKLFDEGRSLPAKAVNYPVAVTTEMKNWDEKGQRSRRWFRPRRAAQMAFEPDLKRFLANLSDDTLVKIARRYRAT